jgi:CHAD domain-containing protein
MTNPKSQIRRHCDRLVSGLRDLLPLALEKRDADAIHDARVATRRLRAALDVLGPAIAPAGHRRFSRVLRRLRRRLGPMRDTDVMLGHLDELAARPRSTNAAKWMQRHLADRQDEQHKRIKGKYSCQRALEELSVWWSLPLDSDSLDPQVSSRLAEVLPEQLASFADQAARLPVTSQVPAESVPPQDPHALRISGKSLRYTIELAAVVGHEAPARVFTTFKRLQDALGLWHDHVVLSQYILETTTQEQLALHDSRLYAAMLDLARQACIRSQFRLRQFATLWSRHGQMLHEAVVALFAPLQPLPPSLPEPLSPPAQVPADDIPPPGPGQSPVGTGLPPASDASAPAQPSPEV